MTKTRADFLTRDFWSSWPSWAELVFTKITNIPLISLSVYLEAHHGCFWFELMYRSESLLPCCYDNMTMRRSAAGVWNVLVHDSGAKFLRPRASDEKRKMIHQTSLHSLKKLFDVSLVGPEPVVFGCRTLRAAGQKKNTWGRRAGAARPPWGGSRSSRMEGGKRKLKWRVVTDWRLLK